MPSPEEMGIKKEDLSPKDRLMAMKKSEEAGEAMKNLAEAFGDIAMIKQAEDDLEAIANASPEFFADTFNPALQKELVGEYEGIIKAAEEGKLQEYAKGLKEYSSGKEFRDSKDYLKQWAKNVGRIRGELDAAKESAARETSGK